MITFCIHSSFQSTLPRRERLPKSPYRARHVPFQSTLPRRERRRSTGPDRCTRRISIHAPAKGATHLGRWIPDSLWISIHAPAKGATRRGQPTPPASSNFNPRSREGSDSVPVRSPALASLTFQSTLPRRERRTVWRACPIPMRFQSTLPRRERPVVKAVVGLVVGISIHAPAKGATS